MSDGEFSDGSATEPLAPTMFNSAQAPQRNATDKQFGCSGVPSHVLGTLQFGSWWLPVGKDILHRARCCLPPARAHDDARWYGANAGQGQGISLTTWMAGSSRPGQRARRPGEFRPTAVSASPEQLTSPDHDLNTLGVVICRSTCTCGR